MDMEEIKLLLEDYKRREKTVMRELTERANDLTVTRLTTKASCYRTFIAELQRALNNLSASPQQNKKS